MKPLNSKTPLIRSLLVGHLLALIFTFAPAVALAYDIVTSPGPDRAGATALDGSEVRGDLYAFIDTGSGIKSVKFYLNGALYHTEGMAPWDFAGTGRGNTVNPFDATTLADGPHQITAQLTLTDNSVTTLVATFGVDNQSAVLGATPGSLSPTVYSGTSLSRALSISASDGGVAEVSLTADQGWLSFASSVGETPFSTEVTLDASVLSSGLHTATITATSPTLDDLTIPVSLTVERGSGSYQVLVSSSPDRSSPTALSGQSIEGNTYLFTSPSTGVSRVDFYLNDPTHSGAPRQSEGVGPFDFAGTAANGQAQPFDTTTLVPGVYPVTTKITLSGGGVDYTWGEMTIGGEGFYIVPEALSFRVIEPETTASQMFTVDHANGANEIYTLSVSEPWLTVSPDMEIAPSTHTVSVNTSGLSPGNYEGQVVVEGSTTEVIPVSLSYETEEANAYTLAVSQSASRAPAVDLEGQELAGDAYIFLQPEEGVSQVSFYLNSAAVGTPTKVEQVGPFDFVGTGLSGGALPFNTSTLADGGHFITAVVRKAGGDTIITEAGFTVKNTVDPAFTLAPGLLNFSMNSTDPAPQETVYLGLNATADGSAPTFSVTSGAPWASVTPASGNAPEALTVSVDPSGLAGGTYTTPITITSGELPSVVLPVTLTVLDGLSNLIANPDLLQLTIPPDSGVHTTSFELRASDDSYASYNYSSNQPWLTVEGVEGGTPETVTLKVDSGALALGSHIATLNLTATGYAPTNVQVEVEVTEENVCTPVPCSEVKVSLPYELEFEADAGGILDAFGGGTGFTYLLPSSLVNPYLPENMELDTVMGVLNVTSTKGILHLNVNNQQNPLSVGFPGPNQITRISTQLNRPDPGTGKYEQVGLWFGYDEDNYVKLVQNSFPGGPVVEFAYEKDGVATHSVTDPVGSLGNSNLSLELVADPSTRTVTAYYSVNGGFKIELDTFNVETEMFSFDAAGIDPVVGTRSFAGILTTHRHGTNPITYEFERFAVEATDAEPPETTYDFARTSHNVDFPTSMVWAPDGKLYVTELFGTIRALTYDENLNVVSDEVITSLTDTLGPRLTLGLTIRDDDPADDSVYSLWVASSSPSVNSGVPNSSTVTRLSGPGFSTVEQVITGLPRAIANHALNSLHFGQDDRLYLAVGGNTGAGSPVIEPTEFGDRAEQALSAAILVADVFAPGFDGTCATGEDIYGPAPCDVVPYATGLRNSYDFVWHSNGEMYATDNGLGVTGAFPQSPTPDCSGLSDATPVEEGGNNPGPQTDQLYRVQEGLYYGHPNPARGECVFKDGSHQGVAPLPNYEPPLGDLGMNASANGIIEYRSARACGKLQGDLLAVRYSLGDDIVRVVLSEDGLSVASQEVLVSGFNDPLTLSEHNGDLFVGEFGSGKVTALRMEPVACWSTGATMPLPVLDAGGVALDEDLYSIAGKLTSGPINSVYRYTPNGDQWTQLANKPGTAVENPAVTTDGQFIYVIGGSTGPFSGAISEVWRLEPLTGSWTALADLPVPVGGIHAQHIDGLLYVAGGLSANGSSAASLQVYDIAADSWSMGPDMAQPRDNAGTAVLNGKLYVMSGRYRLSDGTTVSEGVPSMEIFDPQTFSWNLETMPRGRRAFAVGQINGKLQIVGGESDPGAPGGLFQQVDVYDSSTGTWSQSDDAPAPRHGSAFGTIDNRLIMVGGGSAAGLSTTDTTQILSLD